MYELDKEAFGRFLAGLRKEKGLTQRQLAERLFVSDKAVSKWERGLSLPDTALLIPLAEALDVTVTELLLCRRCPAAEPIAPDTVEHAVKAAIRYPRFHPYVQAGVAAAPQGDRLVCRGPGRRGRRRLRQLPAGQPARRNGAAACDHGRRFRRVLLAARAGPPAGLLRREPAGLFSWDYNLAYQRPRRGLQQRKLAPHREGAAGLVLPGPGAASPGQSRVGLAVSHLPAQPAVSPAVFWAACSARFTSPAAISAVRQAPTTLSHSLIATLSLVRLDRALVILLPFSSKKAPPARGRGAGALCSYFFSRRPSRKASPTRFSHKR